jgi:hypothetical protein
VLRRYTRAEIIVSYIEVLIIRTWIAVQIVVQVGTRRIKTTKRKSVLPPCVKERSKRGPNKRPKRVVQNPPAKKNKK